VRRRRSRLWRALERLGPGEGWPAVLAALTGGGGGAGIARSAGFSQTDVSDLAGRHLQRSTGWNIPASGVLLWYGEVTAVSPTVANVASGYLVGNIGSAASKSGLYLSIDTTGLILTMGRRAASDGSGVAFAHTPGIALVGTGPRLHFATWGLNGHLSECGIGDYHDGDLTTDDTNALKTGLGDQPSFGARNITIAGDGSTAYTRAWTAMVGRMPTAEEWAQLAGGNLDILRGTANINFGLLPAVSGDITLPADVEDIGTDGGDWNDGTRGTGTVDVQGVGL